MSENYDIQDDQKLIELAKKNEDQIKMLKELEDIVKELKDEILEQKRSLFSDFLPHIFVTLCIIVLIVKSFKTTI